MPDISQPSQIAISKALTQVSQSASQSEAARQSVEVVVKHLASNVLSLNKSTALLNKVVLLSHPEIKGKLVEGQTHQIKLSMQNNPSLDFFSQTSAKSTAVILLTEQQLQSILRLPAKQLVPKNLLANSGTTGHLPELNATVLPASPKKQPPNIQTPQNILRLSLTDQRPPVEIALPVKQLHQFTVGEKVTLAIVPKGNDWQLTISQNSTNTSNRITNPLLSQTSEMNMAATDTRLAPGRENKITKDQHIMLAPLLAAPIIKASLREFNIAKPVNFELPIKPVLQQLSKINHQQNQELVQKLQASSIDKISLQVKPSGEIDLVVQSIKPVANIPVTKEIVQALAPLKLPNQQAVTKLLNLSGDTSKQIQSPPQAARSDVLQNTNTDSKLASVVTPVDGSRSPAIRLSLEEAKSNLLAAIQEKPSAQSVISPSLLNSKPEQINLVRSLLRIVQPIAEAPSNALQAIDKALVDADFFKGTTEQSSKQLIEQTLQQIKQALPQGKEQDANQIRQLLTAPALNLSALQMAIPASNQGLMSGLITLLHMSLSARLVRNQSNRSEHIAGVLNNILGGTAKTKSSVTAKAISDISQLEQKHQLMKEVNRLLSSHQTSKLSNAEQMLQGQETFYYNLPSTLGGTIKDIELLIRREDNNKEEPSANEKNNKTWQLTMKLAVGQLGELLTKAKLRSDTLEINFYASNETVKIQVMNYLPLLRRKLDSLGIEISKSQCQLGKIPDTLQQRPYHVFQAKA